MSSPLAAFRQAFASAVIESQDLEITALELIRQMKIPEPGRGDLSLPCFTLAKQLKQNPANLAKQVASAIKEDARWAAVEAVGPYVNVTYATQLLAETVIPAARAAGYGDTDAGKGKTVCIDFSSPNIAKPLAFHHIRSTVIGAAIGRLHAARGWNVVGINYLGDWGKQFGLLATGFARHGDPKMRADAKHLVETYVLANSEADVAGRKATIAAPEEAKKLVTLLSEQRTKAETETEKKALKKANKSVKSLEKKLRSMRSMKEGDPLVDIDPWFASLEASKKKAEATLPDAEAKDQEARRFLKRMEEGEETALAEWQEFRQTSIKDFERVYDRLGVSFTNWEGESLYTDVLEDTVERLRAKPGTKISEGAEVVDLPRKGEEPPILVKTRDGTTLYITRDIAAAIDRFERFSFDRSLYVVAADQSLHFSQLFRTLEAMGFDWWERCQHVPFGRVHGMQTRKGNVIFLDEVADQATSKTREICQQSEKIKPEFLDEVVDAIGVGSLVFGDLRNLRTSNYHFNWAEVLDFSGHTGPYVQFSHARACSIIRKSPDAAVPNAANLSRLTLEEERGVIVALSRYPDVLEDACERFEPSLLTRCLIEIAQATAHYLTSGNKDQGKRVLVKDDDELRAARLHLIDAVRNTLAHGLTILGVRAPEAM